MVNLATATMLQHLFIGASIFLQRVGEEWHLLEGFMRQNGLCDRANNARIVGKGLGIRLESRVKSVKELTNAGRREKVTQDLDLGVAFLPSCSGRNFRRIAIGVSKDGIFRETNMVLQGRTATFGGLPG